MLGSVLTSLVLVAEGVMIGVELERSGYRKKITDKVTDKTQQLVKKVKDLKKPDTVNLYNTIKKEA